MPAGGTRWDSAAPPWLSLLATGLHASRLDGEPLRYGAPGAWLPDLVVCRRELAARSPRGDTAQYGRST